MRFIALISIMVLSLVCGSTKNAAARPGKLDGAWIPVKQEMGGARLPQSALEKQSLILKDSIYIVTAESIDEGIIRCNGDKMDIYGKKGVNTGKHFTAIYKYENGLLTICYNLAGDSYPEAFETKGKQLFFLSVFKKEETK